MGDARVKSDGSLEKDDSYDDGCYVGNQSCGPKAATSRRPRWPRATSSVPAAGALARKARVRPEGQLPAAPADGILQGGQMAEARPWVPGSPSRAQTSPARHLARPSEHSPQGRAATRTETETPPPPPAVEIRLGPTAAHASSVRRTQMPLPALSSLPEPQGPSGATDKETWSLTLNAAAPWGPQISEPTAVLRLSEVVKLQKHASSRLAEPLPTTHLISVRSVFRDPQIPQDAF
ncbi:uncharacterized protein LOC113600107 [Acinonyx jubatus]|uniref:Uncharacterized protein LOC113600107 n=1 Tax=Acinonyx jubatus TaxID=32536 RepID=A0ABM3NUI4_ACIJB|nr:uncharacterized protein LOC113600107 [Acinonyx jubatus]